MFIATNKDRAYWAERAIREFSHVTGLAGSGDAEYDPTIPVADLLCDLRHYCDERGIDFDLCLTRANGNYKEEKEEDPSA